MRIELVHALADEQHLLTLALREGATVADAVEESGWRQRFPELLIDDEHVGIWNRKATLASVLRDGDRVEIHRPLIADPKSARRRRAEANPVGVQVKRRISRS